jgi:xanthine dehydrogenase accessory factor
VDTRETEFPDEPLPTHIETLCSDTPADEVADAPPGAFYLVLTHSHALDLGIVEAVLRRGDFGFLGLIGSDSKRARFAHRLAERGIEEAQLERLVCPIGVAGIEGKQPAVVAIAAVAQLLQQSTSFSS